MVTTINLPLTRVVGTHASKTRSTWKFGDIFVSSSALNNSLFSFNFVSAIVAVVSRQSRALSSILWRTAISLFSLMDKH